MPVPVGTGSAVVQVSTPRLADVNVTVHRGWRTPGVVMVMVPVATATGAGGTVAATWVATATAKVWDWP